MGLSIHFSGRLRKAEHLPALMIAYFERLMKHIDNLKKD